MPLDALASLHNGSLTGKREQTVLTPPFVLDPLRLAWNGIAFDPCAGPVVVWVPCDVCTGKGKTPGFLRGTPTTGEPCRACDGHAGALFESLVRAAVSVRRPDDGLSYVWPDRTYCNSPWDVLEPWLAADSEPGARTAWLAPVRPHRRWWRAWARTLDALVYLDPFPFLGHTQVFPAPLCVGYRGHDAQAIVDAYRGRGEPI